MMNDDEQIRWGLSRGRGRGRPLIIQQQEEANDLPPLFKYPRYKKTPHEPIISHRRSREDSVNNFGRRMQDVADEDLAMNIYGEQ